MLTRFLLTKYDSPAICGCSTSDIYRIITLSFILICILFLFIMPGIVLADVNNHPAALAITVEQCTPDASYNQPVLLQAEESSGSAIEYIIQNPILLLTLIGGIIVVVAAIYLAMKPGKQNIAAPAIKNTAASKSAPPGQQSTAPPFSSRTESGSSVPFGGQKAQAQQQPFSGPPFQSPVAPQGSQQAGIACSQCNTVNAPSRKFCSNCGTNLSTAPPVSPPQGSPAESGPLVPCPVCSTTNSSTRKFCNNCGSALLPTQQTMSLSDVPPPAPKSSTLFQASPPPVPPQHPADSKAMVSCPVCGTQNAVERKFCGNCGSTLGSALQQPPQFASPPSLPAPPTPPEPPAPRGDTFLQIDTAVEKFSCPICSAIVDKGSNPCPKCGTQFDWSA